MHPTTDNYPDVIERAIRALLDEGVDAGARALAPIAYPPREIDPRRATPRKLVATIYTRDHFSCRYCGRQVIPTGIMELLGQLYPDAFPFHPNWKGGKTHPAIISRSPVIDHVVPGSQGGDWLSPDNLVTACWPCNVLKADFHLEEIGWGLRPVAPDAWDGLTSFYPRLWDAAGQPSAARHMKWISAFKAAAGGA